MSAMLARVLPAIVGAGVGLAGTVLWRLSGRRPIRWLVAALAIYGAVAFADSALAGIALRDALAGAGLFRPLPYVLRGAFLGAFLVLPIGWIVSLVRAGIPRFREGSPRRVVYQAVALTLCVALVVTAVPRGSSVAAGPVGASADRVAMLDKSLRAIEDGDRESPRDRWDPDYVVRMIGKDPQALFAWVRANTLWVPYRGVLRGAVGVLMDRQGNSLDRALLLATLLEKAGHRVRLAHGVIDESRAAGLLLRLETARAIALGSASLSTRGVALEPEIRTAAAQYGLDGDSIAGPIKALDDAYAETLSELQRRAADQTERLMRAITPPDPGAEWARRFEVAVEALRDHWWVQRDVGGTWVDHDLLGLPRDDPKAPGLDASFEPNLLPPDLHHRIVVRAIAEQWFEGRVVEQNILEYTLRAADSIGESIALQFWPLEWAVSEGRVTTGDLRRDALEQHIWAATLYVGTNIVAKGAVLDTGANLAAPAQAGPMGGIAGAFANSVGLKQADGTLTAFWIEYEVRVPGQAPRAIRRPVFDLIGPAARETGRLQAFKLDDRKRLTRALSLLMRTDILPVVCSVAPEFVAHLAAQSMLGNRPLLDAAARDAAGPAKSGIDSLLAGGAPTVSTLYTLAVAHSEWNRDAPLLYIDRPGILSEHKYPSADGSTLSMRDTVDIVANDVGVSLQVRDGFRAQVTQGVVDTNAESLARIGNGFGNAGDVFETTRNWVAVSATNPSSLARVKLPDDVRARIRRDVADGQLVVAPERPLGVTPEPFAGWWRIDSRTGQTLGVDANGWGASPEYSATMNRSTLQFPKFIDMMVAFARGFNLEYFMCVAYGIDPDPFGAISGGNGAVSGIGDRLLKPRMTREQFKVRVTASITTAPERCTGRAAVWGIATAVTFVVFFTFRAIIASRLIQFGRLAMLNRFLRYEAAAEAAAEASGRGGPKVGAGPNGATEPDIDPFANTEPGASPTKVSPAGSDPLGPEGAPGNPGEVKAPSQIRDLKVLEAQWQKAYREYREAFDKSEKAWEPYWAERQKASQQDRPLPPVPRELADVSNDAILKGQRAEELFDQLERVRRDAQAAENRATRAGNRNGDTLPSGQAPPQPPNSPGGGAPQVKTLLGIGGANGAIGR